MSTMVQPGKPAQVVALEITATLAGRRVGLCGYGDVERQRISDVLYGAKAIPVPFEERLLGEFANICDAMVLKLASLGLEGLRAAAASPAAVLVTGGGEALIDGTGAAYGWPTGFMIEPWTEAELVVRLFRLFQATRASRAAATWDSRADPLVLLADDDSDLTQLVDMTLRNDGIVCRLADDGLVAIRMARELFPDLLVLDIKMPKMNGLEALEIIRRDPGLQTMPVILLTACQDPVDINLARNLGADQYLAKPLNGNALLNRVKTLLSAGGRGERPWVRSQPGAPGPGGKIARRWVKMSGPYRAGAEKP